MTFITEIGALLQRCVAGKASRLVRRKTAFGSASQRAFASLHMKPTRTNLTYSSPMALFSAASSATTAIFIRPLIQTYHLPQSVPAFWQDCFVALSLPAVFRLPRPRLLQVKRQHLFYLLIVLLVPALLFSPIFATSAYGQTDTIRFENISTEQGLSQNTVNAILQDRQGFMWFGTEGGLNKYDGYQFTVYKRDPDNPKSLSDDVISSMYEDRDGILWIGTSTGLDRFDRKTGTFLHYPQDLTGSEGLSGEFVLAIAQDHSGTLWAGTEGGGLYALDLITNQLTVYKHASEDPKSLSDDTILSIYEDRDGALWIGTGAGLDRLDQKTGTFAHYRENPSGSHLIGNEPVYAIYEDRQGALWIGTQSGLAQWDRGEGHFVEYQHEANVPDSLSDDSIRCIFEDSQGALWIGTRSGLDQLDKIQNRFIHYMHNPNDAHSLISDSIRAIFEDRSGVLWIGTSGGGLSKYARATQKFALYKYHPGLPNNLSDNNIWSVYEDQSDNLWVGTFFSGLNKLDRRSGKVTIYQHNPSEPTSLSDNEIRTVLEDRNGTLWVGTERGGLDRFDPKTETFVSYRHNATDPGSLGGDGVFSIYEDHLGRLWVGTANGGLNRLDQASGTFTRYQHDTSDPSSLSNDNVRAIYEDRTGGLWIGTFGGGIDLWDDPAGHFTIYRHDPNNPSSLSSDMVTCFFEDQDGTVWIGTFGGGLNRFDRVAQSFTHYTEKDGLPDDTVYGILADMDGDLWLSTNKGLSNFDPRAETFRNYDVSDGLQGNQFNPGAYFQSKDGEMFFGGTLGLNAFFPQQVQDNPVPPPLVITAFKRFNQTIQTDLASNETIPLSYHDNFVSLEFAALDYNAPEKNQYAYKLEGIDQDWVYAGTRRYASYTNLRGGDYVFRIKASNNDDVWNNEETTLRIHITPPFWQTWWFIGIIGLLVVSGAVGGYRLRVREIETRNRELAKRVEQRTHELATLNTISEVVNRSLDLTEILNAALDKTIEVMRMEGGLAYRLEETDSGTPDGPILRLLAHRGVSDEYINIVKVLPLRSTFIGETVKTGKPDVRLVNNHPNPIIRKAIEQAKVRLAINVPLLVQGKLVGALTLASWEMREITQEELSLLTAISQQVGMAVVNAQLYEKAEQRTHELERHSKVAESLRDIVNKINSNASVDEVLDFIVAQADVLSDTNFVALWLLESEQGPFQLHSIRGEFPEAMLKLKMDIGEGMLGLAVKERRNIYFQDMSQVQYAAGQSGVDDSHPVYITEPNRGSLTQVIEAFKAIMVVPLLTQNGVYGAIEFFYPSPREFKQEDITLASAFAEQAALAIENAMLRMQSAQAAILSERNRLARELHDSVTQLLYSVTLYAEAAAELMASGETRTAAGHLRDLRDTAQEALREMRLLIFELHQPVLGPGGLAAALQARLDAVETRGGMHSELVVEGSEQISQPVQAELYNIAQEALNNALKHAHANQVRIHLRFGEAATELEVCDDGVGFELTPDQLGGGFGISGMKERAQKIGGTLQIESAPGRGTKVAVRVPVNASEHPNQTEPGSTAGETEG
jgi:signal transduction histidine kinase/ligand-binding sensor domain-containing protein